MDVASSNYSLEIDWQVNKCGSWLLSLEEFLKFKLDLLKYKENGAGFNKDFWILMEFKFLFTILKNSTLFFLKILIF